VTPDAGPLGRDAASSAADVVGADAGDESRCIADERDGFAACRPVWRFESRRGIEFLGGALVADTAALLGTHEGLLYLWLVDHDGRPRALLLDPRPPAADQPANEPRLSFEAVGSVAAGADRFLVAFGGMDERQLWVWVRAVLPPAGQVQFDSPTGSAWTTPAISLPVLSADWSPTLGLFPFRDFVVVGFRIQTGRGFWMSVPVTTTITGAPAPLFAMGFWLLPDPDAANVGGWTLLMTADADAGESYRFLGPLGDRALGVKGRRFLLLPTEGLTTRFQFADGWEPEPSDIVLNAPHLLVRVIPARAAGGNAGCGTRVVAYDLDGRVAVRLALPPGILPVAFGSSTNDVLAADEDSVVLCSQGMSPGRPGDVPWERAAKHPQVAPREPLALPREPADP
jgi:hypothetical protein